MKINCSNKRRWPVDRWMTGDWWTGRGETHCSKANISQNFYSFLMKAITLICRWQLYSLKKRSVSVHLDMILNIDTAAAAAVDGHLTADRSRSSSRTEKWTKSAQTEGAARITPSTISDGTRCDHSLTPHVLPPVKTVLLQCCCCGCDYVFRFLLLIFILSFSLVSGSFCCSHFV